MQASALLSPALISVLILTVGALVILLFTTSLTRNVPVLTTLGTLTLILAMVPAPVMNADGVTVAALGVVLLAGLVGMLLLPGVEIEDGDQRPEIASLLLLGSAGGVVFATGPDLLSAALGLETLSLSGVTMVALSRGVRPLEAAFKYFVLASISFSVLLFGLGLVYLATGSFAWPVFAEVPQAYRFLLLAGLLLVGLGFAYELALVPLHFGTVDSYTAGAPALAGFVMAASKVAAVIALSRLIATASAGLEVPLPLASALIVIGLISIVWGTFAALAQRELRRLLAYSAVANAGFLALALGCGADGRAASVFYAVTYSTTVLLVFAALAGRGTEPLALSDIRVERIGALRALALVLGLLSLAGIPPLPGFWTKIAVLEASWSALGFWPTLIAALGGVFGALYYLRPLPDLLAVVRAASASRLPASTTPAVVLAGVAVVVAAVAPGLIYSLSRLASGG